MPTHGFFITGTDTGVGKTLITCALLHALAARGRRVVGMKPVAAGAAATVEGLLNDDVRLLREASNVQAPLALINPYCFAAPVAPHLAAEQAGITIDLAKIESAFLQLCAHAESIIVEGVGGFCVPLNRSEDGADLARRLQLPVLMVVGVRLGCLNHALLTLKAINDEGLVLAGWFANRIDNEMKLPEHNIAALQERLGAPMFADVAFSPSITSREVARAIASAHLF
jgi:dethiobiotin synthetase